MEEFETILSTIKYDDKSISTLPGWQLMKLSQEYPYKLFAIKLENNKVLHLNHLIVLNLKNENNPIYIAQQSKQQMLDDCCYFDLSVHSELSVIAFFYFISIINEVKYIQAVVAFPKIYGMIFEVIEIAHLYNHSLFDLLITIKHSQHTWGSVCPKSKFLEYNPTEPAPRVYSGRIRPILDRSEDNEKELVDFMILMERILNCLVIFYIIFPILVKYTILKLKKSPRGGCRLQKE